MTSLQVRPMQKSDFDHIINYLHGMSPTDIERMGLAAANIPSPRELRQTLAELCASEAKQAQTFYSIWLVDGEAIGHSSLKNIVFGERGEMHLHMWKAPARGRGFGGVLFCKSAIDFYDRFELKSVICEPRAANPMPNRMLQKVGFPLVKTYVGASSELSTVCELNRYHIDRNVAAAYLATQDPSLAK